MNDTAEAWPMYRGYSQVQKKSDIKKLETILKWHKNPRPWKEEAPGENKTFHCAGVEQDFLSPRSWKFCLAVNKRTWRSHDSFGPRWKGRFLEKKQSSLYIYSICDHNYL